MYLEFIKNLQFSIYPDHYVTNNTIVDWHHHEDIEILLVRNGVLDVYIGNKKYTIEKNNTIVINRHIPHKTQTYDDTVIFLIQFKHDALKNVTTFFYKNTPNFFIFKEGTKNAEQLHTCLLKTRNEYKERQNSYQDFIRAYIYEITAILYRSKFLINPNDITSLPNYNQIEPALNYAYKNYANHITLDEITQLVHINKSYFCRLFKSVTGISFIEYVYRIRLYKAEKLLLRSDKNITEIAYEVGFSSSAYFTKIFREQKGISPMFYRKMKNRTTKI